MLIETEFELVTQALWTDPNDQSGWIYHRWLIGSSPPEYVLRREVKNIRELHETEPDSKCKFRLENVARKVGCVQLTFAGCMNALAHNCGILASLESTNEGEKKKLICEAKALYERLEVVDADRKERYRDMGGCIFYAP